MRIPPVLQFLFWGIAAWGIQKLVSEYNYSWRYQLSAALGCAVLGIMISGLGVAEFVKFKTTLNPVSPDKAQRLVTSGIFRLTRNPMYLGMLLILSGWLLFLGNPFAAPTAAGFVLIMNNIQIKPEERAMMVKFGEEYEAYRRRTRRWI